MATTGTDYVIMNEADRTDANPFYFQTIEQVKAALSQRINTKEQWDNLARRIDYNYNIDHVVADTIPKHDQRVLTSDISNAQRSVPDMWDGYWALQRECNREKFGVYDEPGEVIEFLRKSYGMAAQYWPHVSTEDKTMVAYSPDRQALLNDRQVKTTMGRMLRKLLPLLSDRHIAELEERHKSQNDPTFLQTNTLEGIERVYTQMAGDTGCMRYPRSKFGLIDYHPSAVYTGEGLALAYLENAEGTVKARSVVYVNPADPTDKRYVRVYGDPVLKRKLEANGYRLGGLEGAKLPALRDSGKSDNEFVMPYMDSPGGPSSSESYMSAVYAVRREGEPSLITMISTSENRRLHNANVGSAACQTQSGAVAVPLMKSQKWVSLVTGVTYDRLVDGSGMKWVNMDGTMGEASSDEIASMGFGVQRINRVTDGVCYQYYCTKETFDANAMGGKHSQAWNDEATALYYGMVKLSAAYYPEEIASQWFKGDKVTMFDAQGTMQYIKEADAVKILHLNGDEQLLHISVGKELRKAGYVSVSPVNGFKTVCHKDDKRLVTTVSGRKALSGIHEVMQTTTGEWDFRRNVASHTIMGCTAYYSGTLPRKGTPVPQEAIDRIFDETGSYYMDQPEMEQQRVMKRYMAREVLGCRAFTLPADQDTPTAVNWARTGTVTVETMLRAAEWIVAKSADMDSLRDTVGVESLTWATAVLALKNLWDRKTAEYKAKELALAEANAVDYTALEQRYMAEMQASVQFPTTYDANPSRGQMTADQIIRAVAALTGIAMSDERYALAD